MWVTKVVRLTAVTTALVLGGAGLVATQVWADKTPAKEAKADKLEGTWQVVTFVKDGNDAPKEEADTIKLVLKGDSFTVVHREEKVTGTYKADPAQKPAALDLEVTEGAAKGDSQMGIYELDGDTLRICTAHNGIARPTKFESAAGSGYRLITLKRVKE